MKFPGYEITEELHEFSDSIIYRAKCVQENISVILKVLKEEHPSPLAIARFRREHETGKLFQSDKILKVIGLGPLNNRLVLVLEDFDGSPLKNNILTGQRSLIESLTIAISLCDAISELHQNGVIHCDINPANIYWNKTNTTLKVTGFGISSRIERTLISPQVPGLLEGHLAYMSPEQTGRMNRPVDYRSDFYSLGVTLYELFTSQKPFLSDDPLEIIHYHVAKKPISPSQIKAEIPETLSNIVIKLLEKNAEDRYQSAEGIKADLVESLRQLETNGTIHPFTLGNQDVSSRFQISGKLYGREGDITTLCKSFEHVSTGNMAFTLVSGISGVGKSSLVQELYRPLAVSKGRYITGKYDQYQRNVPYSAIGQAFNSFCDQLLSSSVAVVDAWRIRILKVVGKNGAALIEVIPRLEHLIGPQAQLTDRDPQAAQNLTWQLCQDFLQEICRPEEPLVIFLDDLQWADIASLSLLKAILSHGRLRGLHLVGAYRDNEVESSHPLTLMLDDLRKSGLDFATIHLNNLSDRSVGELISDSLALSAKEVSELVGIIYSKTQGNAFFTTEFFKALYADGLLGFNFERRKWECDTSTVHARQITDNVVTLMAGRIKQLPELTQSLLRFSACIGNQFSLKTLAVIARDMGNEHQILEHLTPALKFGVIQCKDQVATQGHGVDHDLQSAFKFQHDRVQQAAYSLIPEDEKPAIHLHISREMLREAKTATNSDGDLERNLFEIVGHFRKGTALIKDYDEQLQVARLNLQAGLKARQASAYQASWEYFRVARELLPKDAFQTDYDLNFQILLGLAKSSYVAGRSDEAEALYPLLLEQSKTTFDKCQVYLVQMDDLHLQGAYIKAIEVQKQTLLLLGENVPTNDEEFSVATDVEQALTAKHLGSRNISDVINAPRINSPEITATLKTLMSMWMSAYLVSNELIVQWSSMRLVNLSLQHGDSDTAAFAFVQYAYICIHRLKEFDQGYEYGTLALKLADRNESLELRGKVYFMFGLCISHWKKHVSLSAESFRKGYLFSVEGGDWTYATYGAANIISNLILTGVNCDEINSEAEKYLEFLKDKAPIALKSFFLPGGFCALLNLQGKTKSQESFNGEYLDEESFLKGLGQQPIVAGWFYAVKIRSLYLFRCFEEGAKIIDKAEIVATGVPGQIKVPEAYFYSCLMLAATSNGQTQSEEQKRLWSLFEKYEEQMKLWADHCPENYLHKYYLIKGERARVEQAPMGEILAWYDKAIQSAKESNYQNNVAVAYELKGRYWLALNQKEYALNDLREAHSGYRQWGASGKCAMLEKEFRVLALPVERTTLFSSADIDALSLHKASRAISSKIEVRDLIHTMMTIVIENAGADRGAFLLEKNGQWQIEAIADVAKSGVDISFPGSPEYEPRNGDVADAPSSIINFVQRTKESVTVNDPLRDHRFGQDAYLQKVSPRSVLCVPVLHQGRMIAIIYLENKLGRDVFSTDRQEFIQVLTSQIAISLENSTLYSAIKKSEGYFKTLSESLPQLCWIAEADGSIFWYNQRWYTYTGTTPKEMEGWGWQSVHDQKILPSVMERWQNSIRTGEPFEMEFPLRAADGQLRWFLTRVLPFRDLQNKILNWFGTNTDIDDQKKAAEIVEKSERKFVGIYRTPSGRSSGN